MHEIILSFLLLSIEIFQDLPQVNVVLLRLLCEFLHKITIYEEVNMMTSDNLGIVVGPSILRPSSDDPLLITSKIER